MFSKKAIETNLTSSRGFFRRSQYIGVSLLCQTQTCQTGERRGEEQWPRLKMLVRGALTPDSGDCESSRRADPDEFLTGDYIDSARWGCYHPQPTLLADDGDPHTGPSGRLGQHPRGAFKGCLRQTHRGANSGMRRSSPGGRLPSSQLIIVTKLINPPGRSAVGICSICFISCE
jgi:hypothetical protein